MKKILVTAMVMSVFGTCQAEQIIQMNAQPGMQPVPVVKPQAKPKMRAKAGRKSYKRVQPKRIVLEVEKSHVDIDKMLEYNNFEDADKFIKQKLNKNPKDVQAQALWVVSLAKQYKLDPAQKELDELLKTFPKNSDLHYAQGVVDYKRTTSSNMFYRANSQKLLEDAMKEFNTATALDKENYRAYNAAGVVQLAFGNNKEAKDLFQKSFEINPNYSTAIDNLGTMDFLDGKIDDAQKKFNKALVYNTQNTTAMYHLAQLAMQKQDYKTALTYLNNAVYINPEMYSAYNLMGEAYQNQGNEAAAINAFKKSVAIRPEFPQPYLNLADIYETRGDGEFAIEQLKTALSVNPDFYDAKLKIADISLTNGKYNQAIDNYSALVGVKDYNDAALKGLANAYFEQAQVSSSKAFVGSHKDLFKAYDYISKAVDANNQDLELHLAKLKLAKITNQPVASEAALKEIVSAPDGNLVNTVIKGEAYLTLNDYSNAKKSFDAAATLAKSTEDKLYLAEIFLYQKQYDSAEAVLQDVLKTEPTNQQVLSNLDYVAKSKKYADSLFKTAKFYVKSKNKLAAIEYLTHSLSLNPNNASAHLLLAELLEKQKDYQGAIANYKAYLGLAVKPSNKHQVERKIASMGKRKQ